MQNNGVGVSADNGNLYGFNGSEGKVAWKTEIRVLLGRWLSHQTFRVVDFATKLILGYHALKGTGLSVNCVEDSL